MTAPKVPESHIDPHFRSPREYCTHPLITVTRANTCTIERDVRVCVHCGREVS